MTSPYRIQLVEPGVPVYPIGAIADGQVLGRVGEELVGVSAPPPGAHATTHETGGSDEVALDASQITTGVLAMARLATGTPDGTKFIRDDGTLQAAGGGGPPDPHAASHQNGGSDEVSVAGLSGLLADGQTPLAHKTSHQDGGADELALDAAQTTTGQFAMARLATGTPNGGKFIRDDGTLQVPAGGSSFLRHAAANQTVAADTSQHVANEYEIVAGFTTEIAALGAMEIT